jgi:hypothetical protein
VNLPQSARFVRRLGFLTRGLRVSRLCLPIRLQMCATTSASCILTPQRRARRMRCMGTNFELVKLALDELHTIIARTEADPTAAIRTQCERLTASYSDLTAENRAPLDYSSAAVRFAYVYTYVAAHASWVYELLLEEGIRELIQSDSLLRATCLGGGPGTELIGLLNACNALRRRDPVSCFLLDKEDGWAETWAEIDSRVGASYRVTTSFRSVDVCHPPKYENLAKAFDADLFFAIYFLSEVYSFRANAAPFLEQLVHSMKPGALVVYIDNSSDTFTQYARSIFRDELFEIIFRDEKTRLQLNPSEERRALEEYLRTINRSPRLTSNATRLVFRKRDGSGSSARAR